MDTAAEERLQRSIFDLSHYLQDFGYSTLPVPRIPADTIAKSLVFEQENIHYIHLITALPLGSSKILPPAKKPAKEKLTSKKVKSLALDLGADLVGISSVKRIEDIYDSISKIYGRQKTIKIDACRTGGPTQIVTGVSFEKIPLRRLRKLLYGIRSIIVLGLHYPATAIERAAKPPAENFMSYNRVACSIVLHELGSITYDIVKSLRTAGYQAEPAMDITGTAAVFSSK